MSIQIERMMLSGSKEKHCLVGFLRLVVSRIGDGLQLFFFFYLFDFRAIRIITDEHIIRRESTLQKIILSSIFGSLFSQYIILLLFIHLHRNLKYISFNMLHALEYLRYSIRHNNVVAYIHI